MWTPPSSPSIANVGVTWPAITMLFELLVRYDDGTNPVPGLAEAMPVISEDGRTYTYTLRDGVSQWTFRDCSREG